MILFTLLRDEVMRRSKLLIYAVQNFYWKNVGTFFFR